MTMYVTWNRTWAKHTGGTKFYEVALLTFEGKSIGVTNYTAITGSELKDQTRGQGEVLSKNTVESVVIANLNSKKTEKEKLKKGQSYKGWKEESWGTSDIHRLMIDLRSRYKSEVAEEIITYLELKEALQRPADSDAKKLKKERVELDKKRVAAYAHDEDFGSW